MKNVWTPTFILSTMGGIFSLLFFCIDDFGNEEPSKIDMLLKNTEKDTWRRLHYKEKNMLKHYIEFSLYAYHIC